MMDGLRQNPEKLTVLLAFLAAMASGAHAQALCPNGPCAYISGFTTNSLYVFDTSSQTIVNTVSNLFPGAPLPAEAGGPYHVAVAPTPNGEIVFVGMNNTTSITLYNLIAVVNASTGAKNFIQTDGTVGDLTVSSDGSRVFAVETCSTGTCVLVIDTAAPTSARTLPTDFGVDFFPTGFGVALVPGVNSQFYISGPKQGIIEHFDLSGSGVPLDTIDVSSFDIHHFGVAVAPGGGTIYVRISHCDVLVVNAASKLVVNEILVSDAAPSERTSSYRTVISQDGSMLYVDDATTNSIHVISTVLAKELGSLQFPSTACCTGNVPFALSPDGAYIWATSEFTSSSTPFSLFQFDARNVVTGPNAPLTAIVSFLPPITCGDFDAECWIAIAPGAPTLGTNGVAITPVTLGLHANQTGQLTVAPLQAGDTVQWSASPGGLLTVTPLGATATIAAPPAIAAQQPVTVTATVSNSALGTRQATATVTLLPVVSVYVWPAPYASPLTLGQTDMFYATAISAVNPNLTWTVNPSGAPVSLVVPFASIGVTDEAHLTYNGQPPAGSANIHVLATSVEDPTQSYSYALTLCGFSLSAASASVPAAGLASGSFTVINPSSCTWTAVSNATWAHIVSGSSGSGSGPVRFSVDPYTDTGTRTGTLTVAGNIFTITQTAPALSIAKSHVGNFTQRQNGATYTVTVSNANGPSPTSGQVKVTETLPSGLTLASMSGTGWTCPSNVCTRNDPLNPGSSYASITVTVNVSATAPSSVTNQVDVTGGGSADASASDVTSILPFPCDTNGDGTTTVADVQSSIGESLGLMQATHDLNHDGKVNVLDVQVMSNSVLGLGCSAP